MDMPTNKPSLHEPLVDGDLETMSRDELIAAVLRWRKMAPMIKDVCHELSDYRQIAPNPTDLKNHIDTTMQVYRNTIDRQAAQISEMQEFIDELVEDPMQINKRLEQHSGRVKKPRLH